LTIKITSVYFCSTVRRRAFSVAGLTAWNSLPEDMRDAKRSVDSYRQWLKTFLFRSKLTSVFSAIEVSCENALYKFTFDVDLVGLLYFVYVKVLLTRVAGDSDAI